MAASLLDDIDDASPVIGGEVQYLREQVASADDCADLPRAPAHPDPVLKNVIQKDRVLTIVDWTDHASSRSPVADGSAQAGWDREALKPGRLARTLDTSEIERLGSALLIRQLCPRPGTGRERQQTAKRHRVAAAEGHLRTSAARGASRLLGKGWMAGTVCEYDQGSAGLKNRQ